jgi:hypothetical protein
MADHPMVTKRTKKQARELREWCAVVWDGQLAANDLTWVSKRQRTETAEQLAQIVEARAQEIANAD